MSWTMKCLLCPSGDGGTWVDLVRLQEHVMYDHGYSRVDLRKQHPPPCRRAGRATTSGRTVPVSG
jgi:hypothetical protein